MRLATGIMGNNLTHNTSKNEIAIPLFTNKKSSESLFYIYLVHCDTYTNWLWADLTIFYPHDPSRIHQLTWVEAFILLGKQNKIIYSYINMV